MTHLIERRKNLRIPLHATIYVKNGEQMVRSMTRNISISGFYYLANDSIVPGQRVDCIMVIGARGPGHDQVHLQLLCTAHVVRVETPREPGYQHGIACQIERYEVLDGTAHADSHEALAF